MKTSTHNKGKTNLLEWMITRLDTEEASKTGPEEKTQDEANETQQTKEREDEANAKRKAGKQPGAPGYGREQKITVTAEEHHYPTDCIRCDGELKQDAAKAYTAFETVDLEWADPKQARY